MSTPPHTKWKTHTNGEKCVCFGLCVFFQSNICTFSYDERLRVGQIVRVDPPSKDAEGERVECSAFLCIISFFPPSA